MADGAGNKGFIGAISAGPLGTVARLLRFLLLCLILFVIGIVKGAILGPLAVAIFLVGVMAVVIGLWPVHVVIIFRTAVMTKQLGVILKTVLILVLPILLLLWPFGAAIGSVLVGCGYGFGQPLVATFEAVGESRENKIYHALVDGTLSTVTGSCTCVRDFLDFVYHSVFDILDEYRLGEPKNGQPIEIKLHQLPVCIFVGVLGVFLDTPAITVVSFLKIPIMLFKGWCRLLADMVTRHGPCLEAACVPFAGLVLVLWPNICVFSAIAACVCSPFLGLYSAVVVYQESSFICGLNYIVAIVAEFDEYSNDVLHAQEGSCLPRPKYRKSTGTAKVEVAAGKPHVGNSQKASDNKDAPEIPQLNTQKSLRHTLQEVKLVHILDSMFKSMECEGKSLINAGVLMYPDVDAAVKGNRIKGKIMIVGLSAYCTLLSLLRSAKANTTGILLIDGTEVTTTNKPSDRLSDWFFEPLLTIKDQLRAAHLQESEERFLHKVCLMVNDTERMRSWDNGGVEPEDGMRKGELEALARRLQGISTSVSRLPTHRRRLESLMKHLQAYMQDMEGSFSIQQGENKSMKKSRSFNFRSLRKETSTTDERQGNLKEITPNGDEAV